ncbi:MAG: hypothetical protein HZC55_04965 [Verrucomicrobia bacterium]|nr:hypothetical protein [Verrucomicrobiota bacterium]
MSGAGCTSLPRLAPWLLLMVAAVEFVLFDQIGARRITRFYPRWDDQVQYLSEAYQAHETARREGFGAGLRQAWLTPSAQGTLHDVYGVVAFQLAGPSRSAALALNLLALLAWQATLFAAVSAVRAGPWAALAAALLPLALGGPWEIIPGSAYDFRLDHLAMCCLGVASGFAVLSDGFRHRGWSLAFGGAAGITLLARHLSGTYLLLVFLAAGLWLAVSAARRRRLVNWVLAGFATAALAGPFLWISRDRIVDYYWIGHFVGPESVVRASGASVLGSLGFVFDQLGSRHLGAFFGGVAVLGVVLFALGRGARRPVPDGLWLAGVAFLLAPAVIFTLHRQKSEVVVSALVPGVVLLVLAAWLAAAGAPAERSPWRGWLPLLLPLICLGFFGQRQCRPAYDAAAVTQLHTVNTLADELYRRVILAPFPEPNLAIDHLNDALNAEVLRVIFYERHRRWLPIRMTLPTGVVAPDPDDVQARLARSHLVLLTDEPAPAGLYPFDHTLATLRPQLRSWCEIHLRPTGKFTVLGRTMTLYQHPGIPFAPSSP